MLFSLIVGTPEERWNLSTIGVDDSVAGSFRLRDVPGVGQIKRLYLSFIRQCECLAAFSESSKEQKIEAPKPVSRVNIVLDCIERKIIEAAKGPHGNEYQKARLECGMCAEQKSRRKQP